MDFMSVLQRIGAVANALSPSDVGSLPRLVEGCKSFLKALASKLLNDHPACPAMLQYSCDTTPVKVASRSSFQVAPMWLQGVLLKLTISMCSRSTSQCDLPWTKLSMPSS